MMGGGRKGGGEMEEVGEMGGVPNAFRGVGVACVGVEHKLMGGGGGEMKGDPNAFRGGGGPL